MVRLDVAAVPYVEMFVSGIVGDHGQNPSRCPQIKTHTNRLLLEEVEGVRHLCVFSVCDVEDPAGDERITGFGPGIGGVDVCGDGEGFLIQPRHHYVVVDAGGKYDPHAVLVRCQLEIRL